MDAALAASMYIIHLSNEYDITMIRISTIILSILMSLSMSAIAQIEVDASAANDGKYILYVKDIIDSVSLTKTPVYGQWIPDGSKKAYGGNNEVYFKDNYELVNADALAKGVTIGRDENGIFFSIPDSTDVHKLNLYLVKAIKKNDGWYPVAGDNIKIIWKFPYKEEDPENNGNHNKPEGGAGAGNGTGAGAGNGAANDLETDEPAEKPSVWQVSNVDWILIVLILALAAYVFASKKRDDTHDGAYNEEDKKTDRTIADLQRQIDELKASNVFNKKTINEAEQKIGQLASALRLLQSNVSAKEKQSKAEKAEKIEKSDSADVAKPKDLGSARSVSGEKALEIDSSGNGYFRLTRNPNGEITFSLVQNAEAINMFETNDGMLNIFRNDGVISYDSVPKNSHVKVLDEGRAVDAGNGRYNVIKSLELSFE